MVHWRKRFRFWRKGHNISNILEKNGIPSNRAIIPSKLEDKIFYIRFVTNEERNILKDALSQNEIEIEYIWDKKEINKILNS